MGNSAVWNGRAYKGAMRVRRQMKREEAEERNGISPPPLPPTEVTPVKRKRKRNRSKKGK